VSSIIHVDSVLVGTVYVAEHHSSRVSVFHTSGQFVHSFGKRGTGRGELKGPCGVAIDEDGFVLV